MILYLYLIEIYSSSFILTYIQNCNLSVFKNLTYQIHLKKIRGRRFEFDIIRGDILIPEMSLEIVQIANQINYIECWLVYFLAL